MPAPRSESETVTDVTLDELGERGFRIFRNGPRIVSISVVDEDGKPHSFHLPVASEKEQKIEGGTWEVKILTFLAKNAKPVSKKRCDELLNKGSNGSKYGETMARLHREGKIIYDANGDVADDAKKFLPDD
jgi:hypothetical protein